MLYDTLPLFVRTELHQCGWRQGQTVDLGKIEQCLAMHEIVFHSAARAFLGEFSELTFPSIPPKFTFDVPLTFQQPRAYQIKTIRGLILDSLCPVGFGDTCFAFIGHTGTYYVTDDQLLSGVKCPTLADLFYCVGGAPFGTQEVFDLLP